MAWMKLLYLAMALIVMEAAAGATLSDLVVGLPGQPEVEFKQYAGYVTINQTAGSALFYYFVEAQEDATLKPLTLWLNGGPGCSSVGGGAFTELGPFYPNGTANGLLINSQAWNKVSNILFVESPIGVGWSYSNTSSDYRLYNDEKTARDSVLFLLGWFKKFPEYKNRAFYVTGESYAGHYVPQLAASLLDYNKNSKSHTFNLKGIFIGNPLLNSKIDTPSTYDFFWSRGMISDETYEGITRSCDWDDVDLGSSDYNLSVSCNGFINAGINETNENLYIDPYDVILDSCIPSIVEQELRLKQSLSHQSIEVDVCLSYERVIYFQLPEVQKALHANTTGLPYPWSMCGGPVNYDGHDLDFDISPILANLVKGGLRVWVFSGDQDSVIPLLGTRSLIDTLARDLKLRKTISYGAWYQKNQVAGWTFAYGNLTYATIRGAGHMVPYSQPARGLVLFSSFISGKPLPTNPY
ncbi:hypothetical protein O6H91_19G001300 [Diphasiastrum complanatum]|uniref:Uncharacterized protein n=1 Tax=Diphasiastrum complanatum TaxID=34168 RepID=A0ACC2AS30_DIPCM|nr:hypothetical protein O6H91_19G001300 [Diphasiastrum complanatum]